MDESGPGLLKRPYFPRANRSSRGGGGCRNGSNEVVDFCARLAWESADCLATLDAGGASEKGRERFFNQSRSVMA